MNILKKSQNHQIIVNVKLGKNEILCVCIRFYSKRYIIDDLKGIIYFMCMHEILLEEVYKPLREHQRRMNPNLSDMVKNEVLKLLDVRAIYPISYRKWVSPL